MNFTESNNTIKVKFKETQYIRPVIKSKEITENGTYNASEENADGYSPVKVNIDLQTPYDNGYAQGYTQGYEEGKSDGYIEGDNNGYIDGRNTMISRTLTSIDDEALTTVGNYAFAGMVITSVNLPNVYRVGKYGFRGCTGLTEIDLPNLTRLSGNGTYTFGYCEKVTRYNLPKLKTDSTQSTYAELVQTFEGNYALERLELKNDITISTLCFHRCSKLKTLVLGANASLKSTDAFKSTPIQNGTGYIYVPDNKVNAYKTATNWVRFASQIKGYSELPKE